MNPDLERCDREIAEIRNRPDVKDGSAPAWLVTLGINDWETEKRMIEDEQMVTLTEGPLLREPTP